MRGSDRVYRYGGEEFLVIFPEASGGPIAAERLRSAVADCRLAGGQLDDNHLTISIGVATLDPTRDRMLDDWVRRADAALYRAKDNGRDCVVVAD
jgi:diguanylate cyclase (GGDEF)-like protein